jgi:hypothetical protein
VLKRERDKKRCRNPIKLLDLKKGTLLKRKICLTEKLVHLNLPTGPKTLELCTTPPHTKRTHGGVPVSTGFIKVEVSTSRVRWPGKKAVKTSANADDFADAVVAA